MIIYDTPRMVTFRGRSRMSSHMASDLLDGGTEELVQFGRQIGLRRSWLQHEGEPVEHFDLFDGLITKAITAGARLVSSREFVREVIQPKRIGLVKALADAHGLQVLIRKSTGLGEAVLRDGDEIVLEGAIVEVFHWLRDRS